MPTVSCIVPQADKLLSQEFQESVERTIAHLKPDRQIMLYSATFPVSVKAFKDKFLRKPYIVNLMEELTLKGISQVRAAIHPHHLLSTCACICKFVDSSVRIVKDIDRPPLLAISPAHTVVRHCSVNAIPNVLLLARAVLCLRGGEAEGALPEHALLEGKAPASPSHVKCSPWSVLYSACVWNSSNECCCASPQGTSLSWVCVCCFRGCGSCKIL